MTNDIVAVVERLIDAENARTPNLAASVLAPDFAAITRARGVEQDRAAMLQEMANPANPGFVRRLERDLWIRQSGDLAVVRSIVEMVDGSPLPAITRFRNTHVLTRDGDVWTCVAWQVTKLV